LALIIYSNGIIEEMIPEGNEFTDNELTLTFSDYEYIHTSRLNEVPNTWCIWGEIENPPPNEFNKLATEAIDFEIYSHVIFVHDSEINPSWKLTDNIIYKSYSEWLTMVGDFVNEMTQNIALEHRQEMQESEQSASMIFLSTLGHTKDKRVLFGFNPNEQNDNFYKDNGGWDKFSDKIYEYLVENFDKEPVEENKPFVIFSDAKTIVIIEDQYVDDVINKLLVHFERKEKYEVCKFISEVKDKWYKRKTLPTIDPSSGISDNNVV
jgi:DNA-directed RNA polymerase beta subunit